MGEFPGLSYLPDSPIMNVSRRLYPTNFIVYCRLNHNLLPNLDNLNQVGSRKLFLIEALLSCSIEDSSLAVIVSDTISAMRNKQPFEYIQAILERVRQEDYDHARHILGENIIATTLTHFKEEVFVYGILLVGVKSFSHVLNAIERYAYPGEDRNSYERYYRWINPCLPFFSL